MIMVDIKSLKTVIIYIFLK